MSSRRSSGATRCVRVLDQRALPVQVRFLDCRDRRRAHRCDPDARGSGCAGARCGRRVRGRPRRAHDAHATPGARRRGRIAASRPTAVNLATGVARALAAYEGGGAAAALEAAEQLAREDVARNRALGAHGAPLLPEGARVLTHCNTGALACVGYGTALGVIRAAAERVATRTCGSTRRGRCCRVRGSRCSSSAARDRRDADRRQRGRVVDGRAARSTW